MRVFADTYFYLALLNADDPAHGSALRWSRSPNVRQGVTTSWVLIELADAMHLPRDRTLASHFIDRLRTAEKSHIVPASEEQLQRGLALYTSRPDKAWSPTDCLSFIVMADERLTQALTGDHHFTQAGYLALMR